MRTLLIGFFFLVFMSCSQGDERFDQAVELAREGNYQRADSMFTVVLNDEPLNHQALNNRAFVRLQKQQPEMALADINKALELDSTNHRYFEVRSSILIDMNRLEEAQRDVTKALEINDQSAQAYFLLGTIRNLNGNYNSALSALKKSIDIDPSQKEPLLQVIAVYNNAEQYEKAVYEATKLLDNGLLNPLLFLNRGFASMQLGKYEFAKEDFEKVLKMDPQNAAAKNNLGYTYFNMGDTTHGLSLINESLELDNTNPYAFKFRGEIKAAQDSLNAACNDWQKALSLDFTAKYDSSVISLMKNRCN